MVSGLNSAMYAYTVCCITTPTILYMYITTPVHAHTTPAAVPALHSSPVQHVRSYLQRLLVLHLEKHHRP